MKIALIGYGKMGKAIEKIALERGHTCPLKIDLNNQAEFNKINLTNCDVAIEFTSPETAYENVKFAIEHEIPILSGSTGWLDKKPEIEKLCAAHNGSFLYASNYSIGVNLFFELNKKLAHLMIPYPAYEVAIEEVHHTAKLDAPSGTAITLAEQIIAENSRKSKWQNTPGLGTDAISIVSKREDPAPGTHSITYSSAIDDIEIKHTAHSREGFALGAVLAAEFLNGKKGVFSMKDVLGL